MRCAVAGCSNTVHPVRFECGIYTCMEHGNHAPTQGVMVPTNGKCGMTLQLIPGQDEVLGWVLRKLIGGEAKHLHQLLKKQIQRNRWAG